ncbi:hypothetical protein [Nostoc sp. 'Lobaria pulmonaria (5183) cyanobiont']|uniref:hypothetical protein n=1 Tax=Nostoc sp. 'Lobaria pulmonaria (5183) cyanobiont' TaxID=1618022 RepID=UPI000CF33A02|nr:hypothetical protein [Nostoc sp. 'Lobaria pulmonaria (5183) cyanobiont']
MNELPIEVQEVIRKHEADSTTQDPEYKQAMEVFNHSFLCRVDPWPSSLTRAYSKVGTEFRGAGKILALAIAINPTLVSSSFQVKYPNIPRVMFPTLLKERSPFLLSYC